MALAKNIGAYKDCEDYFTKASESSKGIAVTLDSPGYAKRFTQRMNMYRTLLRVQSEGIYPLGHAQHGTSVYDNLNVRQDPDNPVRVIIKPTTAAKVEEL